MNLGALKSLTSIICITIIIITAMLLHMDGVLLAAGVGTIAGLGGFITGRSTGSRQK